MVTMKENKKAILDEFFLYDDLECKCSYERHTDLESGWRWSFVKLRDLKKHDVFRKPSDRSRVYLAIGDAYLDGSKCAIRVINYRVVNEYSIITDRAPNMTWSAKMEFNGTPYLGEGDTEREAIAELVLAMGLIDEVKMIKRLAPDVFMDKKIRRQ